MNTFKRYSEPELKWLRENYASFSSEECADKLGRARDSVLSKANRMGLIKNLGVSRTSTGYVLVLKPKHKNAMASGYIPEHRLIMSRHLGRPLKNKEVVHHINGIRDDNRLSNLKLCANMSEHGKLHAKMMELGQHLVATKQAVI